MLKLCNVTKKYGDFVALENLSFEAEKGCIFGLLGLNGAGKTTTFRSILGLIDDYEGKIFLDNKKIDYNTTDKIGFLPEERSLLTKLTVYDQMILYGSLKSMTESEINEKLDYYLDYFNIKDYKYRKIKELSKGNQQKIQFISAIINDPKLLILDEPFSGLDPLNIEIFKKVILELKQKGTIIIFSSHRMEHVELFCEKLLILVKGKTVLEGNLKEIKKKYKKKNIIVNGEINKKELESLEGVEDISKQEDNYIIKVSNDKYISDVFNVIAKSKKITKFSVEEPGLNEIFLSVVGEAYEK